MVENKVKKYGDSVYFAEIYIRSNVVCFKRIANYFITETWYENRKQVLKAKQKELL